MVKDRLERPSGTAIISPIPVTFVPLPYPILIRLAFHDLPPSRLLAVPPTHGITTSPPGSILGHALPQWAPVGWLASTGLDQLSPSSVDTASKTLPFESEYRTATVVASRRYAPG